MLQGDENKKFHYFNGKYWMENSFHVYRIAEEAFFHHSRVLHSSFFFSSQIAFHYNSTILLILLFFSLTHSHKLSEVSTARRAVRAQSWVLISFSILMLQPAKEKGSERNLCTITTTKSYCTLLSAQLIPSLSLTHSLACLLARHNIIVKFSSSFLSFFSHFHFFKFKAKMTTSISIQFHFTSRVYDDNDDFSQQIISFSLLTFRFMENRIHTSAASARGRK